MTSRANPRHADLQALGHAVADTTVSLDLPDLADFFARHDLQVGAGGGANWERCCLGAPTWRWWARTNQLAVVPMLERWEPWRRLPAGDAPAAEVIGRALRALDRNAPRRAALAERARALVDGHGALRVALRFGRRHSCCVKLANDRDSQFMHRWRNAPGHARTSRSAQAIAFQDHQRWLTRTLADPQRLLLVGEIGGPAGGRHPLRPRRRRVGAEVSLYLDPACAAWGSGTALLREGESAAAAWSARVGLGLLAFVATVLDDNAGSRRLFEAAGYTFSGQRRPQASRGRINALRGNPRHMITHRQARNRPDTLGPT